MTAIIKHIFDQALSLGADERSELIVELLETVEGEDVLGYDEAWGAEIKKRLEDIESGRVKMIPAEESIRLARKRAGLE